MIFFDSHGGAHISCSGNHPEAVAFGPTGISRPLENPFEGKTPYTAALEAGKVEHGEEGDFPVFTDLSLSSLT